ncbi:daunorubicin resistance protein DrrA family ABC transporter ATP-binding protein [Pseudonocardia halophobica]|uniref:Daunorubicin resistance protein DrrA family ABC transporter ATP-binding protein n=1 Tax=Pseudonocardia halophobica TaxID=29401 RepID=A0A9W6LBH7_9PSEU|nr:daunorubicin resistance protein DrrA family ABC transporter ATP-binding protein [Pseudonocardia halophobica]GLL14841.1 daunorubicin resistance protein DrrA family ABC transporter ATP-binding protein [Pseudonocardia halophobica]
MAYTVEVEGLRKSFGTKSVLDGIDLHVARGSVAALLGPNGAGKTTTVKILSTLLRPDAGRVRVAGRDVRTDPVAVRRAISLTGQHATVDEVLTGRENLVMMGRLRHLTKAAARERATALLERFDLVEAADRRVSNYSGGMARRLDIALGLVDEPEVLFLDEPTTGLDPRSRRDVWDSVAELAASGVTVLLTTQYLEEADRLADRVAVLAGGRIAAEGTADELKSLVGGETVQLVLPDAAALDSAMTVADLRGYAVRADAGALSVHVPTDGTAAGVRELLETMAGVPVVRVAVHRPTLDDVFLTLTGTNPGTVPA